MENKNLLVTLKGKPVTLLGERVKPGDQAKDFTLVDSGFVTRSLDDYRGKIKVILVYLSVDTGICAAQNRKFNEMASLLSDDVVVLSVSRDLPYAQSRFCAAEGLKNVITLSDYKHGDFGLHYGFLIGELRLLARGTVILDKDNVVRYVEYVPEIASEPNYDAAMEAVRKIV